LAAIAAAERPVGQRRQIIADRLDAGLRGIGAIGVGPASVAVLGVPIVGAGHRIGVLDLVRRRSRRAAVGIGVEHRAAIADRDLIGAGAAHDRLVVVVAERMAPREI